MTHSEGTAIGQVELERPETVGGKFSQLTNIHTSKFSANRVYSSTRFGRLRASDKVAEGTPASAGSTTEPSKYAHFVHHARCRLKSAFHCGSLSTALSAPAHHSSPSRGELNTILPFTYVRSTRV